MVLPRGTNLGPWEQVRTCWSVWWSGRPPSARDGRDEPDVDLLVEWVLNIAEARHREPPLRTVCHDLPRSPPGR